MAEIVLSQSLALFCGVEWRFWSIGSLRASSFLFITRGAIVSVAGLCRMSSFVISSSTLGFRKGFASYEKSMMRFHLYTGVASWYSIYCILTSACSAVRLGVFRWCKHCSFPVIATYTVLKVWLPITGISPRCTMWPSITFQHPCCKFQVPLLLECAVAHDCWLWIS